MSSTKAILAAAAIYFAFSVNAHMIMKTPTPYGKSTLNNSPLDAQGSDFPCKQRGDSTYDAQGASNIMPIGASQTLSFTGSAVHGGGSCQISLTTDKAPSKSTQWQVIHSIEGGCPANVAGNLPEDPNGDGASTFQFSIPQGIAPGDYTLAWTWFNKIGNREMYMNCAPVTVTSGSGKREADAETPGFTKRDTSFPPMFVANIGNGCSTKESVDVQFPNPGDSVQYAGEPGSLGPPVGTCGGSAGSSGSAATPSASAGSAGSSGSVATPSASAGQNTAPSVFAPGATAPVIIPTTATDPPAGATTSPAASATPSAASSPASAGTASAAGATSSPAAPASSSAASSPASSGTTSPAGALTGPCTAEGDWNCIGGNSYQRCASGSWSIVQPMATGMTCQSGQSATLNMSAAKAKHRRGGSFARGHVRRRSARL
ncbi:hypothetical protein LPUS_12505 [Lasallia pustulata]|uniref:Uncharacterized protein n=1 Tax=Lasallia pustulata TaxID=136370 RepID=A0A1W5DE71_9LECA|nr:hypothetical protein LPUS_12505 [Lasallia pustulata]